MEISNTTQWLLGLKDGDVTFEDIQKTINDLESKNLVIPIWKDIGRPED